MTRVSNKIIESSFYLLFTVVPLILTPFNYELFEFNKMILTYFLTVIILGAWLMKMAASKKIILRRTPLDLPLFLFLFSQFLSFLFSIDRHTSLFGYYSRFNGGLLSIISYILLYYAFVSNMTPRHTLHVTCYMLLAAALISIYGILEHFGIDEKYWVQDVKHRVFSTLGQPNWLAAYIVGLAPLTWALALPNSKLQMTNYKLKFKIPNSILYSLFSILYLCLLYTKSRSGLLALATAYFIFWSLAFLKEKKQVLKPFLIFNFSFLILSLAIGTPWTPSLSQITKKATPALPSPPPAKTEAVEVGGITPSSEIRKIVWRGAVDIFRHYPLLGTGPETFAYSYYWYRPPEHNLTSEWDFLYNKAHNEYLNYLACTGILGFGSYLLIIAVFLISNLKFLISNQISSTNDPMTKNLGQLEIRSIRNSLLAGYAGLLVCHFFGFSVVVTNLFFFLFPAMSFVLVDKTLLEDKFVKKPKKLAIGHWSLVIIILFVICHLSFVICKMWYADFLFAKGKKYLRANAPTQAFSYFQKAASLNQSEPLFKNELAEATSELLLSLYAQGQATAAAQLAEFAVEQSDQALKISPYHLNYLKTRTKIFYNLAQIEPDFYQDALETLLHAGNLAPTDAKIFYNLGVLYHYLGQKNEAIKTMEKTVELKPDYEAAKNKLEEWYNEKE